jgi:hypothetical protein
MREGKRGRDGSGVTDDDSRDGESEDDHPLDDAHEMTGRYLTLVRLAADGYAVCAFERLHTCLLIFPFPTRVGDVGSTTSTKMSKS